MKKLFKTLFFIIRYPIIKIKELNDIAQENKAIRRQLDELYAKYGIRV